MSGIGGHTERFQSSQVALKISNAFGKEINLTAQTKPVITNGFSSVRLSDEDKQFLEANDLPICNPRNKPNTLWSSHYKNGVWAKYPWSRNIVVSNNDERHHNAWANTHK
ncbi:hypothetical protein Aduo_009443 [Ancylostoma duodenale]